MARPNLARPSQPQPVIQQGFPRANSMRDHKEDAARITPTKRISARVTWVGIFLLLFSAGVAARAGSDESAPAAPSTPATNTLGSTKPASAPQPASKSGDAAFFESQVLPILRANCFSCHGAEKKFQGGLRLTSREFILEGGESGPAVDLTNIHESLLLQAVRYDGIEMPPKGKLPQAQIDIIAEWLKKGMPWSAKKAVIQGHGAPVIDEQARDFWAFRPVQRHPVPQPSSNATLKDWARHPVDAFILAKMQPKGFSPAPPASKTTLIRRLYYTVTGLPPTMAQMEAFLNDSAPDAYEKLVDNLLESPHYGEHWGRHWLDLVRYAETNSFERDTPKPFVWRYRDYVIESFNQDKPYDQFIREQLAGDEIANPTAESVIATGFYRLGIWDDEPADPELSYYDGLDDIVATTGQTFLGLTVNCARCHDHKIDPFSQKDYYRMLAFFHGIRHYGDRSDESVTKNSLRSLATPELEQQERATIAAHKQRVADVEKELREIVQEVQPRLPGGERDDFKYPRNRSAILQKHKGNLVNSALVERFELLQNERRQLARQTPRAMEQALCVTEDYKARDTYVLLRGNPRGKGDEVQPGFPAVLMAASAPDPMIPPPAPGARTLGRRRVLADWIANPKNPLTARVWVNRVWQYHFGRGIVRSSSNFGYMGTPPTHPELLDWLAAEFVADGMRHKKLHRLLLTSNTFRMASTKSQVARTTDPENDYFSHFDLRRLSAEELRDSILSVSGNLNLEKNTGPSVYPVIPAEVLAGQSRPGSGWAKSSTADAAARSVFVHIKRSLALPILAVFDGPDPDAPCPNRFVTTQPTQALGMLNSDFLQQQAKIFADQLRMTNDDREVVIQVLRRVTQRQPTAKEIQRGLQFLTALRDEEKLSAEDARRQLCLLALNLNEFIYLD